MFAGLLVVLALQQTGEQAPPASPEEPPVEEAETGAQARSVFEQDVAGAVADERRRTTSQETAGKAPEPRPTRNLSVARGAATSVAVVGVAAGVSALALSAAFGIGGMTVSTLSWVVLAATGGNLEMFDEGARTWLVVSALLAPVFMVMCVGLAIVGLGGLVTAGAFFSAARFGVE